MNQKNSQNKLIEAQKRQQALDSISAEELEKVKRHQARTGNAVPVDNEWLLLAEFAKAFGWQAYLDARDDKVSTREMLTLLEAHRKLEAGEQFDIAQAVLIGVSSAHSKKPSTTFKTLTKSITDKTKVKE